MMITTNATQNPKAQKGKTPTKIIEKKKNAQTKHQNTSDSCNRPTNKHRPIIAGTT